MSLSHHPDLSTSLAYAAGTVNEGFSLIIAAHLESCQQCRDAVLEAEALGGELMDGLPAARMTDNSMDQIWERIAVDPVTALPIRRRPAGSGHLPGVLNPFLPGGLGAVPWRTLVPGIRQHLLEDVESSHGSVRLLLINPGVTVPHHTHLGTELTLVLQGSFRDKTGLYQRGDLADLDSSVQHQPIVDSDQPCICLVATDQRLKFTGALNRMLQPLVGI